jgi:hypothetical protein
MHSADQVILICSLEMLLFFFCWYITPQGVGGDYFELLRSPGMDSKESIPPAYVDWRACTTILFLLGFQRP